VAHARLDPVRGQPRFDPDQKKILFLDELPAAKPAVLGVAYQLILNRRIGSHRLQPNTFIVCAGNRDGDKGVQNKLPAPLNNRMTHYEVAPDAKAWVTWAAGQPRVPAEMLALLSFRPDLITDFDPMSGEKAFATPRTILKAATTTPAPCPRTCATRRSRAASARTRPTGSAPSARRRTT
jgi:hypothetical protein